MILKIDCHKGVVIVKEVVILGLGPGNLQQVSLGVWEILNQEKNIYFRTGKHPLVQELKDRGLTFPTFDFLYEEKDNFADVYQGIVEHLLARLKEDICKVIYAVPGHPLYAEESVQLLLKEASLKGIRVSIFPSMSFLDALVASIQLDPVQGLTVLDALEFSGENLLLQNQLIFTQVHNRLVASDLKLALLEVYPSSYPVTIIQAAGIVGQEKIIPVALAELDHFPDFDHLTSVYIKPDLNKKIEEKQSYSLNALFYVMEKLLSPEGCPWDRQQSHQSLKPYLIEEAYEVIETIDNDNMNKLREELGDLLLQIVFHTMLAQKRGDFTFEGVVEEITQKMIRRHPHVFSDLTVNNAEEVLKNWDLIKATEKGESNLPKEKVMDKLNKSLPALLMAEEVQKKAKKVGFDWDSQEGAWDKLLEEVEELKLACVEKKGMEEELGDLLFAVVNVARFIKVSPEVALYKTIQKFLRRFNYIEEKLAEKGLKWEQMELNELDKFWNEAKRAGL